MEGYQPRALDKSVFSVCSVNVPGLHIGYPRYLEQDSLIYKPLSVIIDCYVKDKGFVK